MEKYEEVNIKIYRTQNYEIFKKILGNRDVNPDKVRSLVETIKARNLLHVSPIIVNEKLEIIDGQHRLEVAKELGLPIFFIKESLKDDDIISLNVNQSSWSLMQYVNYYAKRGDVNYKKLLDFSRESNLSLILSFIFLTRKPKAAVKSVLSSGQFLFPTGKIFELATIRVKEMRKLIIDVMNNPNYNFILPVLSSFTFIQAIANLPLDISNEEFFNNLRSNIGGLEKLSGYKNYLLRFMRMGLITHLQEVSYDT